MTDSDIAIGITIEEKADRIISVAKDVSRYLIFKRSQDLGIVYGKKDLKFTDFMLFSLIKEKMGG